MIGFFVTQYTHYAIKNPSDAFPLATDPWLITQNGLRIYAFNATTIFCAVAQLRLLGYDLGSGFRFPFLSSSVAEFYRRWNYYFFEFSTSIFYLPLAARLRRWLPVRVAYVLAGYPSVLLGVWAMHEVLYQVPLGLYGKAALDQLKDWRQLAGYVLVWSCIILPQLALAPFRSLRRSLWWRVAGHVATVGVGVAILVLCFYFGVAVY
jgi:D-alanyl-lipoteichoic acid acyltransferase DltB (MBOAT superfamily)